MTLSTWRASAVYTTSANTVAAWLAGLKALVDAELAAHPTTALWQVSDYSAGNGTLVLKPTTNAASGVGARRVMFFGGVSTPSSAAVGGQASLSTSYVCCGVAPTANVDAPQQAYATGAPFTTGLWVPGGGIVAPVTSGAEKLQYFEMDQCIVVTSQRPTMVAASGNLASAIIGQMAVTMDGTSLSDFANGSSGLWTADADGTHSQQNSTSNGPFAFGSSANLNNVYGQNKYNDPIDGVVAAVPAFVSNNSLWTQAENYTGGRAGLANERYFFPIPMRQVVQNRLRYKMRQMAWGVSGTFGEEMLNDSGVRALKLGTRSDVADQGPWLTNFQA